MVLELLVLAGLVWASIALVPHAIAFAASIMVAQPLAFAVVALACLMLAAVCAFASRWRRVPQRLVTH